MNNSTQVGLNNLHDVISHPDTEKGAYRLDLVGFNHVYRFVRRIIERSGQDVLAVLFTACAKDGVEETRVVHAVDVLEQAIYTSLRRSDISTKYSQEQIIVILMDTDVYNGSIVVQRIVECYQKLCVDECITISHEIVKIESNDRLKSLERRGTDKKTILIVDDNATNLVAAESALSELYKVVAVSSGARAIRYFEKNTCDLILLDINMPDLDGFETMNAIRKMPYSSHVPIIFLTADNDPDTESKCLKAGAVDYITKPFVIEVLRSRIGRTLELEDYRQNLQKKVAEKTERITYIQDMTVLGMATMVESRDNSTGGHIKRTGDVVRVFTKYLYESGYICDVDYVKKIIRAAPMHDLGKIAINDQILRKNGKFTDEEYREMKQHSAEGAKVIEKMLRGVDEDNFVDIAVNIARHHHERWDGRGYPDGKAGEEIPFEARIMSLADVFDALVSKRCYKASFTFEKSFSIIEESLGTQFDPELGRLFLECRKELEELYKSYETE